MSKRKPLCYAPWIATYEYSTGDIVPCCEWNEGMRTVKTDEHMSMEDRFNHPVMQEIKDELLTSKTLPPECHNCVQFEKHGGKSMRKIFDEIVEEEERKDWEFDEDKFKLLFMDYRESNLCNFSCMMCGADISSTIAKIEGMHDKKTGILKNPHKLQMYLDRLDEVNLVNFLGGEPMLTESMWIVLKELRRRELHHGMRVSIVTNGSLLHRNEDHLMPLLEGFKFVDISVSIDCIGKAHNYWRSKNSWKQVEANCKELYKWKQGKHNVNCATRTAIGWPNSFAAKDVFDKFKDMDIENKWNLISHPEGLAITNLPQDDIDKLVEHWKDYPDVQQVFMNTKSKPNILGMNSEIIKLSKIEKTRDIKFGDAFPDTVHLYNKLVDPKNNSYFDSN